MLIEEVLNFMQIVCSFIGKLAHHHISKLTSGSSSIGRAIAFQAIGREFETRLPLETVIKTLSQWVIARLIDLMTH